MVLLHTGNELMAKISCKMALKITGHAKVVGKA